MIWIWKLIFLRKLEGNKFTYTGTLYLGERYYVKTHPLFILSHGILKFTDKVIKEISRWEMSDHHKRGLQLVSAFSASVNPCVGHRGFRPPAERSRSEWSAIYFPLNLTAFIFAMSVTI